MARVMWILLWVGSVISRKIVLAAAEWPWRTSGCPDWSGSSVASETPTAAAWSSSQVLGSMLKGSVPFSAHTVSITSASGEFSVVKPWKVFKIHQSLGSSDARNLWTESLHLYRCLAEWPDASCISSPACFSFFPLPAWILGSYSIYVPGFSLMGASGDSCHNTGN